MRGVCICENAHFFFIRHGVQNLTHSPHLKFQFFTHIA